MTVRFHYYESGMVRGIRYTFEHPGEGIPAHKHDASTVHNTIVLRGAIALVLDGRRTEHAGGEVCDFDGTNTHEIIALAPDTVILNLLLNPAVHDFSALTERDGIVNASP